MNALAYCEQLLEIVAAELNIKEVRVQLNGETVSYHFDTINHCSVPDQDIGWASLIFTGDVTSDMKRVREFISEGLNQRSKAGIRVRQPLQTVTINLKGVPK